MFLVVLQNLLTVFNQLNMSDNQTYYPPNGKDLDQFPDIAIWITKGNTS